MICRNSFRFIVFSKRRKCFSSFVVDIFISIFIFVSFPRSCFRYFSVCKKIIRLIFGVDSRQKWKDLGGTIKIRKKKKNAINYSYSYFACFVLHFKTQTILIFQTASPMVPVFFFFFVSVDTYDECFEWVRGCDACSTPWIRNPTFPTPVRFKKLFIFYTPKRITYCLYLVYCSYLSSYKKKLTFFLHKCVNTTV